MNGTSLSFLVQQLAYRVPGLVVCVAGFIVALVYMRRYPAVAILTLAATGVLAINAVGAVSWQAHLFHLMRSGGWTPEQYSSAMSMTVLASSFINAVGMALLVIAVFVGRHGPTAERF